MSKTQRFFRELTAFILTLIVSIILSPPTVHYDSINYSEFIQMIEAEDIDEISVSEDKPYAVVHQISTDSSFELSIVSKEIFEKDVYNYSASRKEFKYSSFSSPKKTSWFLRIVIILFINILYRAFWNAVREKLSTMKATEKDIEEKKKEERKLFRKLYTALGIYQPRKVEDVSVKFSDVIGLEKQINEIQDIVKFLKEPEKYKAIGAQLPKGVLLYGKPGVGKTYIARAIAGEAGVPFFETSASEFNAKYWGEAEERIRKFFAEAEENAPAIIYIDEFDSIATRRYSNDSSKYSASVVNQLLSCMDGFSKDTNVIVIAATNHIDTLDEAVLRSGRFDRKIYIHEPDKDARKKLIEYYSKDKSLAEDFNIDRIVDITSGLTGADIKTILNEAAILAVRKGLEHIDEDTVMEAFRKVELGTENNHSRPSKNKLKRTSIHEAGHAVVGNHFGHAISEMSIISRGTAAGYNLFTIDEDNSDLRFDDFKHEIMCLLAGRAAEELEYNDVSAGAYDDLKKASAIISDMFLRYSLRDDDTISLVLTDNSKLNDKILNDAYDKMNEFIKKCYQETLEILKAKKKLLMYLAERLLKNETLSKSEIEAIFGEKLQQS